MLLKVALNTTTLTLTLYFFNLKYNCKTLLDDGLAFNVVITYFASEGKYIRIQCSMLTYYFIGQMSRIPGFY